MTISIDGTEIGDIVELAMIVGSIAAFVVVAIIIYFLVRPPRRRPPPMIEAEPIEAEEMLALMDRMERRLVVLERAVTAEAEGKEKVLEAGAAPEQRRVK